MYSMTAFARKRTLVDADDTGCQELTWEIKTVNHKYLDIHLRVPEELKDIEMDFRKIIAATLTRGRVDATLKPTVDVGVNNAATLDVDRLGVLKSLLAQMAEALPDAPSANLYEMLSFPGILSQPEQDTQQLSAVSSELLKETLSELVQTRQREGAAINDMIAARVAHCQQLTEALKSNLPEFEASFQERWATRLKQITDHDLEPARLHQELALLINKSDVSEEIDRLSNHSVEVLRVLSSEKKAKGRRLDFLMQELGREANTLGAKSNHPSITSCALELKVTIEQMREQVQNVE